MAHRRETEEAVRGETRQRGVWERLTRTILTLVGVAGLGVMTWSRRGSAPMSAARAALAALLVYVPLCALIVRIGRAMKERARVARAEGAERHRQLRRRPYNVGDEAEAVLAHAHGRRGTR